MKRPVNVSLPIIRREALLLGAAGVGLMGCAGAAAGLKQAGMPGISAVRIGEGTNIAVFPSPDGKHLAFDLLGLLWIMPASGGAARCITDSFADIAYPCWSPDGAHIAFQSYRSGNFHIWRIAVSGGVAEQLTHGFYDQREPCFSPDGRFMLFSSDKSGRYAIHQLDLGSGKTIQRSFGNGQDSEPCYAPDGQGFVYIADGRRLLRDAGKGEAKEIASVPKAPDWTRPSGLYGPSFSPDGALAYVTVVDGTARLNIDHRPVVSGEDIFPFRPGWLPDGSLIYASNGKIRRLDNSGAAHEIPFTANAAVTEAPPKKSARDFDSVVPRPALGITSPQLSPDGKTIAFGALNDIYVLDIGDPTPRRITNDRAQKCHPSWSPDGYILAYCSDKGGTFDIWLHDLATGKDRQLTNLPMSATLFPCWSRDGERIAFLDNMGALHSVEVTTGEIRQVYDALWQPGRPSFSPDGRAIAMAAFKPVSARFREGLSEILIVDLASGKGRYTPIRTNKSIATRGDDGPVWSPDGQYFAYVFASTLWVQSIAADGSFVRDARQISTEATDAPSWSGDSQKLLYLGNGKLRIVSVDGGAAETIPMRLNWARARTSGTSVVKGARIWDALAPRYQQGDLVLEGNRIAGIAPVGSVSSAGRKIIDASGLVVMPGLIDMHTHRQVQGAGYGTRMGRALLSMGITATRSPGGAAYHAAEDREAIDAGLRLAPREFNCGEALDGSRIYYNFMRPVTEPGQMALELSRAKALAYDMIKTYVRMDHHTQAEVIDAAHALGLPVSSHYHYPALRQGADCTEHLGATSRFGFSRTITLLGAAYQDVSALFAAAKAGRTPTLFAANALLPDYPDLVDDARIRTLLPQWDYARFIGMAKMISESDRRPLLAALERNVEQIKDMMSAGWHVHTGTDAPIDTVGISYHLNLRAMVRFGIPIHEALLTATRHAGDFLGVPLGTIAKGQLADLILVEGDPLAKIDDVARVRRVIRDGRAYRQADLVRPFVEVQAQIEPSHIHSMAENAGDAFFWHKAAYVEASRIACCVQHPLASA